MKSSVQEFEAEGWIGIHTKRCKDCHMGISIDGAATRRLSL